MYTIFRYCALFNFSSLFFFLFFQSKEVNANSIFGLQVKRQRIRIVALYLCYWLLCYCYWQISWWLRRWSVCLHCGRHGFNPWVGKISWRRKLQPTPICLPRKSLGRRSLVGYSPTGPKNWTRLSNFTFAFTTGINKVFLSGCLGGWKNRKLFSHSSGI